MKMEHHICNIEFWIQGLHHYKVLRAWFWVRWNKKICPWFRERNRQLEFGKTRVSNNYCNKGGATNADTKRWSCQNRPGNISRNACGKDAICERSTQPLGWSSDPAKPHNKPGTTDATDVYGVFEGHLVVGLVLVPHHFWVSNHFPWHHPLASIRSHIFPIIPVFNSRKLLKFACPIHCWASHGSSSKRLQMQLSTTQSSYGRLMM